MNFIQLLFLEYRWSSFNRGSRVIQVSDNLNRVTSFISDSVRGDMLFVFHFHALFGWAKIIAIYRLRMLFFGWQDFFLNCFLGFCQNTQELSREDQVESIVIRIHLHGNQLLRGAHITLDEINLKAYFFDHWFPETYPRIIVFSTKLDHSRNTQRNIVLLHFDTHLKNIKVKHWNIRLIHVVDNHNLESLKVCIHVKLVDLRFVLSQSD